jgi:hypothetical protein
MLYGLMTPTKNTISASRDVPFLKLIGQKEVMEKMPKYNYHLPLH